MATEIGNWVSALLSSEMHYLSIGQFKYFEQCILVMPQGSLAFIRIIEKIPLKCFSETLWPTAYKIFDLYSKVK